MDEFPQEIDQAIRQCSTTEPAVGGEEGHPEWHTMPAEFIGFFDRDPLAVCLQDGRGEGMKQGRGELEGLDDSAVWPGYRKSSHFFVAAAGKNHYAS